MVNEFDSALREEVRRYLSGCEYLLAAASNSLPFTEDELAIIKYYVAEVGKILHVSTAT